MQISRAFPRVAPSKGSVLQTPAASAFLNSSLWLRGPLRFLCSPCPPPLQTLPYPHPPFAGRRTGLISFVSFFAGITVLHCLSHCLKAFVSYILSSFLVYGWRASSIPVIHSWLAAESPVIFSGWPLKVFSLPSLICSLFLGIWLWYVALDKSPNKILNHKRRELEHKPPVELYLFIFRICF